MIPQKERLVVAFNSTHDAIAFEAACEKNRTEGRLIPLPKEISAGCGLAWSAPPGTEKALQEVLQAEGIKAAQIRLCLI